MHPHLPADVGQNLMSIFQLNTEHCIWKRFLDHAFNFNDFFFCHPTLSKKAAPLRTQRCGKLTQTRYACKLFRLTILTDFQTA